MEIRKTKKIVKEIEVVTESYIQCDKCGEKISKQIYEIFDFDFEVRKGLGFPSGGNGIQINLDLCQKCCEEALNLLEENGFKIHSKKWDY
jgi:hypothetical protein